MKIKSQSGIEFLIITAAVFFFFILILVSIQGEIKDKNIDKERIYLREIGIDIKEEIDIASSTSDGYSRKFSVPLSVIGVDYSFNITGNFIYLMTDKNKLAIRIINFSGFIQKGDNVIRKQNGSIFIN